MFTKLPDKYRGAFEAGCATKNNWRFAILPFFNILTQVACYFIYLYVYPVTYPELPHLDRTTFTAFSALYVGVNIVFSIVFFQIKKRPESPSYVRRSHIAAVLFILAYVTLEGFETLMEVEISGNIYRFLATFFVAAFLPLLPRIQKFVIILVYTVIVEAGLAYMIYNGFSADNYYQEIILGFFVVCALLSNIFDSASIRTFMLNQDLIEANEKLKYLTVTDALTNIYNRRAFNDYMQAIWEEGKKDYATMAVLMIDIDYFKAYNDRYGHQKGDECLVKIADCIKTSFSRSTDMVARYGGEEFIVLLPHTTHEVAKNMAESLRKKVEDMHIENGDAPGGILTISVGVATDIPGAEVNYEPLIRAADKLLYQAKNDGRNRVRA